MRAYRIFQHLSPEFAAGILAAIREKDRDLYSSALASLAAQKKLRPIFIQKKPLDQQMQWAHRTLQSKPCDEIAEHVLRVWLLGRHAAMLGEFLDALGIAHDGSGAADDLPEQLDAAKLQKAIDRLFAAYEPTLVTIYLHLFQQQRSEGWKELGALLDTDERVGFRADIT